MGMKQEVLIEDYERQPKLQAQPEPPADTEEDLFGDSSSSTTTTTIKKNQCQQEQST